MSSAIAFHFRSIDTFERGGITVVYDPHSNSFGVAVCQKGDAFCKRTGYNKALGRAHSARKIVVHSISKNSSYTMIKNSAAQIAMNACADFNEHIQSKIKKVVAEMNRKMIRLRFGF